MSTTTTAEASLDPRSPAPAEVAHLAPDGRGAAPGAEGDEGGDVEALAARLGREWPALSAARRRTPEARARLREVASGLDSEEAALVVYGSLARKEWTPGSDVDWSLLVDGRASAQHLRSARAIARRLEEGKYQKPGPTGVFGNMTFSHDLYNKIGGQEDSNENTTQRVLLLLESVALGRPDAHERTLRLIIDRYLTDDRGLLYGTSRNKVPRYLANDIVRYWRTITVDFVDKQRGRPGAGWALRHAKLRLSRKLIFVAGLLSCLGCELYSPEAARQALSGPEAARSLEPMAEHLLAFVRKTPLDIVAHALLRSAVRPETAAQLFDAYDGFLAILEDDERRAHLKALQPEAMAGDALFRDVTRLGRRFQEALTCMFFREDERLTELTIDYGVF